MPRLFLILVAVVAGIAAGTWAHADEPTLSGASPEHVFSDEALIIEYPVCVVARIQSVNDPDANTNGNPPKLTLRLYPVLKGLRYKRELDSVWLPFPHDIDWENEKTSEAIAAWKAKSNPPPEINSRWILFGRLEDGKLLIAPRCRYKYSEEKLRDVREILKRAKKAKKE